LPSRSSRQRLLLPLLLLLLLLSPAVGCTQAEKRVKELMGMGLNVQLVTVGNKGTQYFKRRPQYTINSESWHAPGLSVLPAARAQAQGGVTSSGGWLQVALVPCSPAACPPASAASPQTESFSLGATPTTREAQAIADEIFADFVSAEVDKVELVFTKFVSLINSTPTIQVRGGCGGCLGWGWLG
jgi:hypothetical protein